ncbi:MAG: cation transporter [Clostridia bacterium]|nr:cation transporter [Clostridia bacterium]
MTDVSKEKVAYRVSAVTIIANTVLSVLKLIAGVFAHSSAMISDALHSASDVFSTVIVILGIKLSSRESDKTHPYGHERFECVSAIVLSAVLCATGIGIGIAGIEKIASKEELTAPGLAALIAAAVSIAVKEIMYRYTASAAKKINSPSLKADAWHHRSDALSSVGSFVGILGARLGLPILDPIAAVVIALLVVKAAIEIFSDAIGRMTDRACDDETVKAITETVASVDGVKSIDLLNTRVFGDKIYVDVEIGADENLSFKEVHDIAEEVHSKIEREHPNVKHCMVHANPVDPSERQII